MAAMTSKYTFPQFWYYPPYFTIQPIAETFEKQKRLWLRLILDWCMCTRTFTIDVHSSKVDVFSNKDIGRYLDVWEKRVFLDALCEQGKGRWVDERKDICLVLWKPIEEWANDIYGWCTRSGDRVILIDDLRDVDDGSEISGLPMEYIVMPAIDILEVRKLVKRFRPKGDASSLGLKIL